MRGRKQNANEKAASGFINDEPTVGESAAEFLHFVPAKEKKGGFLNLVNLIKESFKESMRCYMSFVKPYSELGFTRFKIDVVG